MKEIIWLKTLILFLILETARESQRNLINFSSEIHLVVSGGTQSFIRNSIYFRPSQIRVNGEIRDSCITTCNLQGQENNVILYYNYTVKYCYNMFDNLDNIKEIDFSDFDFSRVTSMSFMFHGCHNLKKINFGNANTSSVKTMQRIFYNCSLLSSLDLSSFDTSSLTTMEAMFYILPSLTSIDLSNFNTKNVRSLRFLFFNCEQLTSIDISNLTLQK